jgi:predicted nucleic acid-binding Zn ribbon protein
LGRAACASLVFASVFVLAGPARADDKPTLSGTWSASSMTESWSTKDWGEACGPKPTSGGGAPGGTVTVSEQGGELAFAGAGRPFTTAQCWEQLPGMTRTSHSASARGWSTRCGSAPGDPRSAVVVTNLTATDETIVFAETGTYSFFIQDTACKASVSRSRSFKLIQRAGATAASASAAPAPPPSATAAPPAPSAKPEPAGGACADPGPPARLEVRPARKLLRPGESFTLAVSVMDARGCRLSAEPEVSTKAGGPLDGKVRVSGRKIEALADAPEGAIELTIAVAGKSVAVTVEVAPPDKYEGLLKERGLNASGEDDRPAVAEIEAGLGGAASQAEDTARARKVTFVAIVGGVAALLALGGFVLLRRGRRARPPARDERESELAPAPNVALFDGVAPRSMECPTCGAAYPAGAAFCNDDGSPLAPSTKAPPASTEVPSPVATSAAPSTSAPTKPRPPPQKICPTCGDMFPDDATFCGKDGTQLVPVN